MQTDGYDCVLIPGALKATNTAIVGTENICGRSAGLVTATGMTSTTVCSEYDNDLDIPWRFTWQDGYLNNGCVSEFQARLVPS